MTDQPEISIVSDTQYYPTLDEWHVIAECYIEGLLYDSHSDWNKSRSLCVLGLEIWSSRCVLAAMLPEPEPAPLAQLSLPGLA